MHFLSIGFRDLFQIDQSWDLNTVLDIDGYTHESKVHDFELSLIHCSQSISRHRANQVQLLVNHVAAY